MKNNWFSRAVGRGFVGAALAVAAAWGVSAATLPAGFEELAYVESTGDGAQTLYVFATHLAAADHVNPDRCAALKLYSLAIVGATEPTHYVHRTVTVKGGERLSFTLAPGGGCIVRFVRAK